MSPHIAERGDGIQWERVIRDGGYNLRVSESLEKGDLGSQRRETKRETTRRDETHEGCRRLKRGRLEVLEPPVESMVGLKGSGRKTRSSEGKHKKRGRARRTDLNDFFSSLEVKTQWILQEILSPDAEPKSCRKEREESERRFSWTEGER